jgi:hypothetical protein
MEKIKTTPKIFFSLDRNDMDDLFQSGLKCIVRIGGCIILFLWNCRHSGKKRVLCNKDLIFGRIIYLDKFNET